MVTGVRTGQRVNVRGQAPTVSGTILRANTVVDPVADRWLTDHAPPGHPPLLPLSAVIQNLCLAAQSLHSDRLVLGLRGVELVQWVTIPSPLILRVVRRATVTEGDVADLALLAVEQDDQSSRWQGYRRVAMGRVLTGKRYPRPGNGLPPLNGPTAAISAETVYGGGGAFHGPAFQVLSELEVGPTGYRAILDAGGGSLPHGLFNQAVLDGWAHGAVIGTLGRWLPGLGRGTYLPWRIDWATFHGPSPRHGNVRCEVRAAGLSGRRATRPVVRVQLSRGDRIWAEMRVTLRRL